MATNMNNQNNSNNRNRAHPSATSITSLITKLQQSFSDAMSAQKTTVDRKNFEKTYKNMNKVLLLFLIKIAFQFLNKTN